MPAHSVKTGEPTVRFFGVFTEQQEVVVDWLKACRIPTVAMEATGICWVALYDRMEAAGLEVVLVERR